MNNRNWQVQALILEIKELGSSHKIVTFLINNDGQSSLLKATLFGGAKSKLSSYVLPFYTGTLYLYTNPVKDANKIVDFCPTKLRLFIRQSLFRIWAASFASEVAIKLKGCISWILINAFLDGVNVSNEGECHLGLLRFIWRIATNSGTAPPLETCEICHKKILKSAYFDHSVNAFLCDECCTNINASIVLHKEAQDYLLAILNEQPKEVRKIKITESTIFSLSTFLFRFVESMAGSKFYSFSVNNPIVPQRYRI